MEHGHNQESLAPGLYTVTRPYAEFRLYNRMTQDQTFNRTENKSRLSAGLIHSECRSFLPSSEFSVGFPEVSGVISDEKLSHYGLKLGLNCRPWGCCFPNEKIKKKTFYSEALTQDISITDLTHSLHTAVTTSFEIEAQFFSIDG